MTTQAEHVWKSAALNKQYLEGVRGAIPFAQEQIDLLLRLTRKALPDVGRFLDLGCGDGILGRALHGEYPSAVGVYVDFSETMIAAAKQKVNAAAEKALFIVQDYGHPEWLRSVSGPGPFDLIVSGLSIHHQPDPRKRELFAELFGLLVPGGLFLNLEHVASASAWIESAFDDYFIEALWRYQQQLETATTFDKIAQAYHDRPDKAANILAPVEAQCRWLRELGFVDVDCYFKIFELALFGGRKPVRP